MPGVWVVAPLYGGGRGEIVYYKASFPAEKNALTGGVIDRELTDLLANDFHPTDRI